MTGQQFQNVLAEVRSNFMRRWAPPSNDPYHRDFEVSLDQLIYAVFAAAQEPFIHELKLKTFRDNALQSINLSPDVVIKK